MPINELHFTVDSHLLGELGERLVTRNYIALAELIKNSYDADATGITIRFMNASKSKIGLGNSEIQLIDDGHGMTFEQVEDYWMRVATPNKARSPISKRFGRTKTGNKGLGRFACRRLAGKLVIETAAHLDGSSELEWTRVFFDWSKFEPGTLLSQVSCEYETRHLTDGTPGLTLRLTDLAEGWSNSEFNLLRRQVLGLSIAKGVRREGFEEDPGFEIAVDAPEFPKGAGALIDQFMDAGWGRLTGRVTADGVVALTLEAKDIGRQEYHLPNTFGPLKGIAFEISWIPIKKEHWRDTKTLTQTLAQEVMFGQGGVRVYLDSFRVYPYGDPGDDWLGIDRDVARRVGPADQILTAVASKLNIDPGRAMLNHPRHANLIGKVYITSGPHMPFQIKLDREGFVWNSACDDLVKAIRLSVQWMVLHYNKFLLLAEERAEEDAEKEFVARVSEVKEAIPTVAETTTPLALRAVDWISSQAKKAYETLPEHEREKSRASLEAARQVVERSFTRTETYLGILRGAASTGALMFTFSHEVKNLISRLDTHANTLDRMVSKLPPHERSEVTQFARSLRRTRDRLDQQIQLFGMLVQKTSDTERKRIPVKGVCTEVVQGFQYLIEEYRLNHPKLDVPDSLRAGPMLEVELFSIIVNLISNAVKAILAGQGRSILVQGSRRSGNTVIRVFDDGVGLTRDFREAVFQPLTADPGGELYKGLRERIQDEDLAALGRGTGVGLNIVRSIAETYRGTARFVDTEPPWKTCVEVVLP